MKNPRLYTNNPRDEESLVDQISAPTMKGSRESTPKREKNYKTHKVLDLTSAMEKISCEADKQKMELLKITAK
jgi:hypothetical protein